MPDPFHHKSLRACLLLCASAALVSGCGGEGSSQPVTLEAVSTAESPAKVTPATTDTTSAKSAYTLGDRGQAHDFLLRIGFGGTMDEIDAAVGQSPSALLREQFAKPYRPILPDVLASPGAGKGQDSRRHTAIWWDRAITGDDPLRQRMVFALSQILVASDIQSNDGAANAYYLDILGRNAFGNYRDLLEEITYSPAMAQYLTYLRNRKGDPSRGRLPDENYAREILQLFSIGLVELNKDGTLKLDGNGQPIETYTNEDIVGLARVFTGLTYDANNFAGGPTGDALHTPLEMSSAEHSPLEKSFLGTTIPAGTGGEASIDQALDTIFNHPNVAPFVAGQLIQRFTLSNPNAGYVRDVARAFETGRYTAPDGEVFGNGQRGDLLATLAAVHLDDRFVGGAPDSWGGGKMREPVLRFAGWARAMGVRNVDAFNEWSLLYDMESNRRLSQGPFRSRSVFNFYRPGYVPAGTRAGRKGRTVPELQIHNEGAVAGYNDFMHNFVFDRSPQKSADVNSFAVDFDDETALAGDPAALVDHLDTLLMGGRMDSSTRTRIIEAVSEIDIREPLGNAPDRPEDDRRIRARLAVYMAVTSPEYYVQY